MPETTAYPPGTPSWIDLGTPDIDASTAFYGGLFGWQAESLGPDAGNYTIFTLKGKQVAGAGPLMQEGQPTAWMNYVATDDADASVAKVKAMGGTVFLEPMDVMDAGRMAVFADPAGAVIAVWQPKDHKGAQLVNEPGTWGWSELATRDVKGSIAFYEGVFGWVGATHGEDGMAYTEWKVGGRAIGGMMEMGSNFPAEVPPHWSVYFVVEDCDGAVSKAESLGASVLVPAMDIEPGRFSALMDPQGAAFSVIKLSEPVA